MKRCAFTVEDMLQSEEECHHCVRAGSCVAFQVCEEECFISDAVVKRSALTVSMCVFLSVCLSMSVCMRASTGHRNKYKLVLLVVS